MVDRVKLTCPGCGEPSYASRNLCHACRENERIRAAAKVEAQKRRGKVGDEAHRAANLEAFAKVCAEVGAEYRPVFRAGDDPMDYAGHPLAGELE